MHLFRTLSYLVLLLFFYQANAAPIKNNHNAIRSFWHPGFECNRLAYCDGEECGKPVADHYCQLMGYDCSVRDIIAPNVGLTHALTNRIRCTGWHCDGFMTISCLKDLSRTHPHSYHYREKEFVFPRYNDYRVDWCYQPNCGCGARAANAFCSHMGFLKASYFERECHVQATKAIGNQQLCFGDDCNAFKTIVCYR